MANTPNFHQQTGLLDAYQFGVPDVIKVTGLTKGQLKGILDRQHVVMRANHKVGTGNRRMFCGRDIFTLKCLAEASHVGLPLNMGQGLAVFAEGFIVRFLSDSLQGAEIPEQILTIHPNEAGDDWGVTNHGGRINFTILPSAVIILNLKLTACQFVPKVSQDFSGPAVSICSTSKSQCQNRQLSACVSGHSLAQL